MVILLLSIAQWSAAETGTILAANDNLDTANGFDIMSIFRDVINEWYVADTSRKIRDVFKSRMQKAGETFFCASRLQWIRFFFWEPVRLNQSTHHVCVLLLEWAAGGKYCRQDFNNGVIANHTVLGTKIVFLLLGARV